MTNIVNLTTYSSTKARKQSERAAALLATVAHGLLQIGQTELKSKEDLQQALLFIALSNAHLRQFVGHIRDNEGRARMIAQTDRIEELVEDAGRKAAALRVLYSVWSNCNGWNPRPSPLSDSEVRRDRAWR